LVPRTGMLARVPKIDEDTVVSRQGLHYLGFSTIADETPLVTQPNKCERVLSSSA